MDYKGTLWVIKQRSLFWRPHSAGYTNQISLAGIYSKQVAEGIVRGRREPPDIMTPLQNYKEELDDRLKEIELEKQMIHEKLAMLGEAGEI